MYKLINSNTLEIKKSKFIAMYYEIDSLEDANKVLEDIKKEEAESFLISS